MRYAILLCAALAGCTTMHKTGITQDDANRDKYECERDAYNSHAQGFVLSALYKDCMRARGYK